MMLSRVFASKGKKCYQSSFVSFFHTSSIRRASTGTTIKNVLVLGSSGALGSAMVDHLSRDCGMKVIGADIHTQPQDGDNYVQLPSAGSLGELTTSLALGLDDILDEGNEIDAIVCANGGWEGDPENIAVDGMAEGGQQYGDTIDRMIRVNLYPVVAAGYAAQHFMANEGKQGMQFADQQRVNTFLLIVLYCICRSLRCHWSDGSTVPNPGHAWVRDGKKRFASFRSNGWGHDREGPEHKIRA